MTYTVWLGDGLFGETELVNDRVDPEGGYRSGNFFPSPGNEALIPTTDLLLQLRDASGQVIPTEWVTVYDLDANTLDDDDFGFDEQLSEELEASVEHDAALIREWTAAKESESFDDSDDESFGAEFSRYQIQLKLAEDVAIP